LSDVQNTLVRTRLLESRMEARDCQIHLLTRLAGCGTWTYEPDIGELTLSSQAAALLGLIADARLGFEQLLERVHKDDRARVRQAFGQALRMREEFNLELRIQRADGTQAAMRCAGRHHASALDPSRLALSGVLQPADASMEGGAPEPRRLGAMVERLERLHDLERRSIASRLLTEIAPHLNALRQRVDSLAAQQQLPAAVYAELAAVADEGEAWLNGLRGVLFEMLPPAVGELGFAGALDRYASEQMSAAGIQVTLALPCDPMPLAPGTLDALYQSARAGIDNVVRHAGARHARISVACEAGYVVLTIEDDGIGIRQADLMKEGALGLWAESERLASAGGELSVHGRPGRGTVMEVRVPVRGALHPQSAPQATLQVA
jgi:signal transduction histidine kinase